MTGACIENIGCIGCTGCGLADASVTVLTDDASMSDDETMPRWPDMDDSKRCVATSTRTGERCKRARARGATVCDTHGASTGRVKAKAAQRVQEGKALTLAKRSAAGLDLSAYSDPIKALEHAIGHTHVLALRLAQIAGQIPDDQVAYHTKSGSYLRAEITGALKALDSLRAASDAALRIGLEARRAGITQATADMLDAALNGTLAALGLSLDDQMRARQIFRGKIRVVGDGEPA